MTKFLCSAMFIVAVLTMPVITYAQEQQSAPQGVEAAVQDPSVKHAGRYVDEFAFRLNEGNVARPTMDRLESMVEGSAGKRLTYKDLIQ